VGGKTVNRDEKDECAVGGRERAVDEEDLERGRDSRVCMNEGQKDTR